MKNDETGNGKEDATRDAFSKLNKSEKPSQPEAVNKSRDNDQVKDNRSTAQNGTGGSDESNSPGYGASNNAAGF